MVREGVTLCGVPEPGDVMYSPDGDKYVVKENGMLEFIEPEPKRGPSWSEKLAARIFCPACFLPLFVPGHKFKGCNTW